MEVLIMKVCLNCRLTYDDQAQICAQCGAPLTSVAPQPMDPTDHTAEFDAADVSQNKVLAMIPYLFSWLGIAVTLLACGTSPYAAFHVKQALKIQVCCALLGILAALLCWTILVPLVCVVAYAVLYIVNIICFFGVCGGKAKEPAIVSSLKFLK